MRRKGDAKIARIREQAESFLHALFGDFFGRGLKGFIEIRIIGPGEKREQHFFSSIEALLDALPLLKAANNAGANIYMGVNPRFRERGREEDVQHVVALHVDIDKQHGLSAVELAKRAGVEPSIVIHSGHGLHLYWLLRDLPELADNAILELAKGINASLAASLGGDKCHDLGRVLRIPGFWNVKDPNEPQLVELVSMHPERRFTLNDFDFLHPVPLPSAMSLPGASDDPPEISERLDRLLESDPDVRGRFDGDPKGLNDTTASGIDLSLASLLSHRGCGFEEFTAAAKLAPYNRNRQSELTSDYLTRTWSKTQSGKNSTFVSVTVASAPPMSNNASVPPSLTPEQALVMLPDVLAEIVGFLQTYLALSEAQAYVLAVWIFHTHVIDAADCTPYLNISSPEKRAGKTLLLEIIYLLAREPWFTSNASAAALARVVAKKKPTSLLDEADTFFATEGDRSETLRGILNAGYRRGGTYSRCVGQRATMGVEDLDVFGPKAIAGLRELPDTIADRSIPIRMKRALPGKFASDSIGAKWSHLQQQSASGLLPVPLHLCRA